MSEMLQRQTGEGQAVAEGGPAVGWEPSARSAGVTKDIEAPGALDQLDARLETLAQTIDLLEFKLAGVLHQQYSEASPELRVEPGTRLAGMVQRLEGLTGMVRGICDRVDL